VWWGPILHFLKRFKFIVLMLFLASCVAANTTPVSNQNNQLTHGNVQMNIVVGETTQAQILDIFGAPNITTIDGEQREVWSYQRHATVAQSSASSMGWTVILLGGGSRAAGFESSTRTMTLIIKFDAEKVVSDFNSRYSSF
jgi:outer membrane protein assembly factor BamE (lipoprotein component of BamABCDE complex)